MFQNHQYLNDFNLTQNIDYLRMMYNYNQQIQDRRDNEEEEIDVLDTSDNVDSSSINEEEYQEDLVNRKRRSDEHELDQHSSKRIKYIPGKIINLSSIN